ncbi:MAG: hypothetical protein WDZ90_02595 [Candidatus Paceibacterota bacterium]
MKFLPGKKHIGIALFSIVMVVGFWFVFGGEDQNSKEDETALQSIERETRTLAQDAANRDSDNDGLLDWEEELWGTHKNNPDTDGDGTNDGDEVDRGRDPTIPGPNDSLENKTAPSQLQNSGSGDENLTDTDRFSREFFENYFNLRQSGILSSEQGQSLLLSQAIRGIGQVSPKTYTSNDLKISNDSSKGALRAYGNALGDIISSNSIENENEAVILLRALENEDESELQKLDEIKEVYEGMAQDMLLISVPGEVASLHLNLLNNFLQLEFDIEAMKNVYTDPIRVLTVIQNYRDHVKHLGEALLSYGSFFKSKNITFGESESGSILTGIIKQQ